MFRSIAAALVLAAAAATAPGITPVAFAQPLPSCQFEDGNPNGQPCMWTDPDTGRQYWVGSENYR